MVISRAAVSDVGDSVAVPEDSSEPVKPDRRVRTLTTTNDL